ncbi:MAG TPA: hypothetical protein VGJ28_25825 [Micromonosporaceae bacterium]|jgi:hypothetical protein
MDALVAEATKKAAIIWVSTADGQPAYPLWCLPADSALYVVTGGAEQPAPGLAEATTATVIARGDHGGRIASWRVAVERVPAEDPIVLTLAGKRLNAPQSAAELAEIWSTTATIVRLTPVSPE